MAVEPGDPPSRSANGSEVALLASIGAGDPRAFAELYRLHRPALARFVGKLLGRSWLAEEVVDDTMMVVWHRPDSYHGGSRFSTWLFAIAYRKAIRARSRQDVPIEDRQIAGRVSDDPSPDREAGERRIRFALDAALAVLSADHRMVVELTYFHDLSYREIAEIMECPVDTVKTRMFHARRHLRRSLTGALADWL